MTHRDTICVEAGGILQVLPIPIERSVSLDLWCMHGQVPGHAHAQLSAAEALELIARIEMALCLETVPAGWRGLEA
jgi:hypothetical protein